MKTASISNGHIAPAHSSRHAHRPLLSALRLAAHRLPKQWEQLQIAIALSEAGDAEGAKAWLAHSGRPTKRKSRA
jgi:hypothetical protein